MTIIETSNMALCMGSRDDVGDLSLIIVTDWEVEL